MPKTYRPELEQPLPHLMSLLPVHRGYPVPWFVEWIIDGKPQPQGVGEPDFRVMSRDRYSSAIREHRCWVCGGQMAQRVAFVIGPMCAVNRTSAEPPAHVRCGLWSARNCPFLARPHARRRDLAGASVAEQPGIAITRNPGCAGVWETLLGSYGLFDAGGGGLLFNIGEPRKVTWWAQGREATREEVLRSIETGMPLLREYCHTPDEHDALDDEYERALELVP